MRALRGGIAGLVCALAGLALLSVPAAGAPAPAKLRVRGLGLLGDLAMRRTLILLLGKQRGPVIGADALDDAALILFSTLQDEGYLEPAVTLEVRDRAGRRASFTLDPKFAHYLPRPLAASEVVFRIRHGRRYTLSTLRFEGLHALPASQARGYFRAEGGIISLASERAYSPDRLKRSLSNFLDELQRHGYAQAMAGVRDVRIDHATGRVSAMIVVEEGPRWVVRALRFRMAGGAVPPSGLERTRLGKPWSPGWKQDAETAVRSWYYKLGYPDVSVQVSAQAAPAAGGVRDVTAVAAVNPGSVARIGKVSISGNRRTRAGVLRPLVHAKTGDLLDPLALQQDQFRISRLGVFNDIGIDYDPPTGPTRDVQYDLSESDRREFDLLAGWGSFDELRGGIETHSANFLGLADSNTLKLVQSLKSSSGEFDYTVPELFGSSVDETTRVFGIEQIQRAVVEEEYGATMTFSTRIDRLGIEASAGYTFERLKNFHNTLAADTTELGATNAAGFIVGVSRDRLDNPLDPHHGYKIYLNAIEASRVLGGQTDFQQAEFAASYHTSWGSTRWLHFGFRHDVVTTFAAPENELLPPNVLFFPGGDESIRGYALGQAAPRDANGAFLGAKSVFLLSVELEQALTSKLSLVLFNDSLGEAARLADYPFNERLYAVGVGLRYRTLIGPLRLEYGRNLNPRPLDPSGTVLFSVGFPF